jgi:hypothetical protein
LLFLRVGTFAAFFFFLGVGFMSRSRPVLHAGLLNTPLLINVEVGSLGGHQSAIAEVELPEGVHFYSQNFPEIREKRTMRFSWYGSSPSLPLIVTAEDEGIRIIKLRLYDPSQGTSREKTVSIQFSRKETDGLKI